MNKNFNTTLNGLSATIALAAAVALQVIAGPVAAAPNMLSNGGFESPIASKNVVTLTAASQGLTGWTIGGDSISLVGSFWVAYELNQSIDLDGNGPGSITQTLPTDPGRTYHINFVYSQHPNLGANGASMTVLWGGASVGTFTFPGTSTKSNMGWLPKTLTVTGPSNSTNTALTFRSNDAKNQNYGIALDATRVSAVQDPLVIGAPSSVTYGTPATATTTGGSGTGAVTFSAGSSTGCSIGTTTGSVTVTNATGTCTITATKAADSTYGATTSSSFPVTLVKAPQSLSLSVSPSPVVYSPAGASGTVTASGGTVGTLSFTAAASTSGALGCSVNGSTGAVTVTNATGSCVVTASLTGDNNYASTSSSITVPLAKANQATLSATVTPGNIGYTTPGTASATGGSSGNTVIFQAAPAPSSTTLGCAVNGTTVSVTDATGTCSITGTMPGNQNYNDVSSSAVAVGLPPPLSAPVLIRVITLIQSSTSAIIGRVDGLPNAQVAFNVATSSTCTNGVLGAPLAPPATYTNIKTDGNGYFLIDNTSVPRDAFAALTLTSPLTAGTSACLASSPDNDSWPKALDISSTSGLLTSSGIIDAAGEARWFKFKVTPGQKLHVVLTGKPSGLLPADYDVTLHKDIKQIFDSILVPSNAADLTKLTAEYAPSAFLPSAFLPSAFLPSAFLPSAFLPSAFLPSAFLGSSYSPSAFLPSAFLPSAFLPSAFLPSAFLPSAFLGANYTPDEVQQAFSSAQTRSLLGVSATPGLANESILANTWANAGYFYLRVAGRSGAYSTTPFSISVEQGASSCTNVTDTDIITDKPVYNPDGSIKYAALPPAGSGGYETVILTDSSAVRAAYGSTAAAGQALTDKLLAFAGAKGQVIDFRLGATGIAVPSSAHATAYDRVRTLKAQAASNSACPYAMNLVAQQIKAIVDSYRKIDATTDNTALRYVVIAGNDAAIPFFRYPDESLLGEESDYVPPLDSASPSDASLRSNFVLSQDAYGSKVQLSLRTSQFPVPGLAVGRLVETADDIGGMLDAYTSTPGASYSATPRVVQPSSSLVTGYDFVADVASAVAGELQLGTGKTPQTLITPQNPTSSDPPPWNTQQLSDALLGTASAPAQHDLVFLAGHFSANNALAADFDSTHTLLTLDLARSAANFTNSIVFSVGCHSGYNIVDADILQGVTLPLDWAQTFAQKKATLIAGTGFQYGDTAFIEYSERLYLNFARELRAGQASVPIMVGEALVKAKLDYLAATPDIRGIHQKALLEATLFGLPMLGVNMPNRVAMPPTGGAIAPLAVTQGAGSSSLGLKTAQIAITTSSQIQIACPDGSCNAVTKPALQLGYQLLQNTQPPAPSTIPATWWQGPDGVVTNAMEPVLPLVSVNVTPTASNLVLRGVGFRGGTYADNPGTFSLQPTDFTGYPLTGAPATEASSGHVSFLTPVFFPMSMWQTSYFSSLGGSGGTNLLVTPVQHRGANPSVGTSLQRKFSELDLRLYYSADLSQAALSDAPAIVSMSAQGDASGVTFTGQVVGDPSAGIQDVWITYDNGSGTWQSVDLHQCINGACGTADDSRVWMGTLTNPPLINNVPRFKYIVQAANGAGLVTRDDNFGAYFAFGPAKQASTLTFTSLPSGQAAVGDNMPVSLNLMAGATPAAGKSVAVAIGQAAQFGLTDANGNASVVVPVVTTPGTYAITASFAGDDDLLPSGLSSTSTITVAKAVPSLVTENLATPLFGATLSAPAGSGSNPLGQKSVQFTFTNTDPGSTVQPVSVFTMTDPSGNATVRAPSTLYAGHYSVAASFAGTAAYQAVANVPLALNFASGTTQQITLTAPASAAYLSSFTVTATTTATTGSGLLPVTVTVAPSSVCTIDANNSVTMNSGAGTCTVTASQAGNAVYLAATTSVPVTANPAVTSITITVSDATYDGNAHGVTAAVVTGPSLSQDVMSSVMYSGNDSANVAYGPSSTPPTKAGSYTASATYAGTSGYYQGTSASKGFLINQVDQTITFATIGDQTYSTTPIVLSPTAPGGTVTLTATGQCTLSPASAPANLTLTGGGMCTVTADQAGSVNYKPAPQVIQSFSIAKLSQTITFGALTDKTTISTPNPFAITATSTSGLSVGFTAAPSATCAVSGSSVTIVGAGTCTITASQAGDGIYNAATPVAQSFNVVPVGTFSSAGTMAQPRSYHTATLLCDGTSVLVAGGFDASGAPTATSEIYTYGAAPPWKSTPNNLPNKSAAHAATLIGIKAATMANPCSDPANVRVLITGGGNAATQLYSPSTGTWTSGGGMSSQRSYHTATRLKDGRVLIVGGSDNSGKTTNTTLFYDPSTGAFTNGPTMTYARERHTATLLSTGEVVIAGGRTKTGSNYTSVATTEVFDPGTGKITTTGALTDNAAGNPPPGRFDHRAVTFGAAPLDRILALGGNDGVTTLATAKTYDTTTDQWSVTGSLNTARRETAADGWSYVGSNSTVTSVVLVAGGRGVLSGGVEPPLDSAEIYVGGVFSANAALKMGSKRYAHTATAFTVNGVTRVLVVGGVDGTAKSTASTELYQ